MSFGFKSAPFKLAMTGALLAALFMFGFSPLAAQEPSAPPDHAGHEGMSMPMDEHAQMDPAVQRKLLADKKESEFNHHLAGFFVILAGIFIFAEGVLTCRWYFLPAVLCCSFFTNTTAACMVPAT